MYGCTQRTLDRPDSDGDRGGGVASSGLHSCAAMAGGGAASNVEPAAAGIAGAATSQQAAALAAERIGMRTTAVATAGLVVGGLRAIGEHAPMLPLAAATGLNAAMFGSTFFGRPRLLPSRRCPRCGDQTVRTVLRPGFLTCRGRCAQ